MDGDSEEADVDGDELASSSASGFAALGDFLCSVAAVSASSSTGTALTKKGAPTAIASGSAVAKPKKRASRLWADLMPALSAPVLATVAALGFVRMTPVQAATIPLFTTNKDVAVQACTGAIS